MDRNRDFMGKFGIVTGAASGIGLAAAKMLAQRGAGVALVDIQGQANEEAAATIRAAGGRASAFEVDLTREDKIKALVEQVEAEFGAIDFMTHAASLLRATAFVDLDSEEWDLLMNSNLRSAYLICRAVVPTMIKQGQGAIVIVSSGAGRSASITGGANYTVSKAGQIALSRHLAQELGPKGIRVNTICPGVTYTPMARAYISEERFKRLAAANPLRFLAEPEDQAAAVAFLLSPEARFINGATLDVNGGSGMH